MIAAIYARKSTQQLNADPEAKSVARQVENARAFATARQWTVLDAHVDADDAVSGAETKRLVNRQRLIDLVLRGHAPFQVLIMRDQSRFSRRDGDEAFAELKQLAQAGVALHFYRTARRSGSARSLTTSLGSSKLNSPRNIVGRVPSSRTNLRCAKPKPGTSPAGAATRSTTSAPSAGA